MQTSRLPRRLSSVCLTLVLSLGVISLGVISLGVTSVVYGGGAETKAKGRPATPSKSVSWKTIDSLLKSKSEQHWEKGLAAITPESLEDDHLVASLAAFAKREAAAQHFGPALVRAIELLAEAKQTAAYDELYSLLDSKDFRVVMATADLASRGQDRGFLEPLMKLPQRPEYPERYGFRSCVMKAVGRYRDKGAVDFLVNRLGSTEGQLKYEMAVSLQQSTGQEFGGKSNDWKEWWKANQDQFVFATRVDTTESVALKAPPKQIPWDEPRPSFYGMTIYAKRVVFVIDRSGSMASTVDGVTRLERAQQELQRAIKALTETDMFNIVAFDDRMEVFKTKLVQADEANKKDGIRFAYGLEPRGETACYEPLKMGLDANNNLELMLFLSDGEPNSGALPDPSAIVVAITNHNLTQRTTIHTIGIDCRDSHELFLKNLAEKNSGKLLLIR